MDTVYVTRYDWPLTPLWLASSDSGLVRIEFGSTKTFAEFKTSFLSMDVIEKESALLQNAKSQLRDYFRGKAIVFNVPLDIQSGTLFQRSVWRLVAKIPFGKTQTYGQLARALNNPGAARAVGAANGANPVPIVIPCHRVVQSDGKLGGYGGGLDAKDALLRLEGALF